jgi:hypothetical protein
MKCLRLLGLSFLATIAVAAPDARTLLNAAQTKAKVERKNVLVVFRASWSDWGRRLDALLDGPELGPAFQRDYIVVRLNVQERESKKELENPGAAQLMVRLGGRNAGVPFYAVLDPAGRRLITSLSPSGENIEYPTAPEEIEHFLTIVKVTAPRMTEADRTRLETVLRKPQPG